MSSDGFPSSNAPDQLLHRVGFLFSKVHPDIAFEKSRKLGVSRAVPQDHGNHGEFAFYQFPL